VRIAKHRNGSLETIKLRALLHIQKFVEEEGDDDQGGNGGGFPSGGGNWKPLGPSASPAGGDGAKLFIQKGSKMNNGEFDDGFDEASPF
jgi:replicative DNA helicase